MGLIAAIIAWTLMGAMIVKQRVPAFIITLGGLLTFRGLHWLIIKGQTIPVVRGGGENLYSHLTTYYLPSVAGYVLAALGEVPSVGESVEVPGYTLTVTEMDGRRIARLRVRPIPVPASAPVPSEPGAPAE